MIKIAFVIDTIESPTAGTEKQLLLLIRNMDRTKFEPYLCVLRTSNWLENEFSRCKLIDIGIHSFTKLTSYFRILKFSFFLRKEKINIIQTFFKDGNKVGVIAGKLGGVQAIVASRRNQGYWHTKIEIIQLYMLNKFVDFFLTNCQATKNWIIKTEKIKAEKISVIYNPIDCKLYHRRTSKQRIYFRKKLGFSNDTILIGHIANLRPVKSIDLFIKAANIIRKSHPATGFIIVGEGPERARLEQLCESMKLDGFVRFLGERSDIPNILGCIDIGVLVSSSESFSNAIIEYMATGLPVVCTDVGGAREAVEDEINGFVVEPGNYEQIAEKNLKIINNEKFVDLGKNGIEKSLHLFSLNKIITQYEFFYQRILQKF